MPADGPLHRPRRARPAERGIVLLWTTLVVLVVAGVVFVGTTNMAATTDVVQHEFATRTHARQVAEAGLVAAISWFQRQAEQPVVAFAPRRDLAADPPVDETDDPARGLVREFQVGPGVWGQFVVRPGADHEPFRDRDGNGVYDPGEPVYDLDGNGRRTMAYGTRPLTSQRGLVGVGMVWLVESEGRVFVRPREDLPLGEGPNRQIAVARLATEIRRLNVSPPIGAALVASQGREIQIREGVVTSTDTAIAYGEDTGTPKIDRKSRIDAPTRTVGSPDWAHGQGSTGGKGGKKARDAGPRITTEEIFGVDLPTLRAMADLNVGTERPPAVRRWRKDAPPYTFPEDSLVVLKPWGGKKIKFDQKYPLRGSAVVVVEGDVEIKKKGNHSFDGILVVLGKLKVEGPAVLNGTVIVRGPVEIRGRKQDVAIRYDEETVTRLIGEVSAYRRTKASYSPLPWYADGRANESWFGAVEFGGRLLPERSHPLSPGEILSGLPDDLQTPAPVGR